MNILTLVMGLGSVVMAPFFAVTLDEGLPTSAIGESVTSGGGAEPELHYLPPSSPVRRGGQPMSIGGREAASAGRLLQRERETPTPPSHLIPIASVQGADPAPGSEQTGDLVISDAYARATLPNAPVASGFVTVTNTGEQDDRLIAARSTAAGRVEIHSMAMEDGVMRMRPLDQGLSVPAGQSVTFEPGGYHLMFIDPISPFVEGDTVEVILTFEQGGDIEVPLTIGGFDARGAHAHPHAGKR